MYPQFKSVILLLFDLLGQEKGFAMETKALKKQLGAAIAMVLVAAVALGSATYAWFVSNNTVDATTSNVSAKSNSAYLVIDTKTTSSTSTSSNKATDPDNTKLFPAQWKNTFTTEGGDTKATDGNSGVYQFETAYASDKAQSDEKANTRFSIGNADAAIKAGYAYKNVFFIGTGGYDGEFTNLKVTGATVTASDGSELSNAVRVLVTCDDSWVVVKNNNVIESQSGKTADFDGIIKAGQFGKTEGDATVKCYVYYDGSDDKVYTDNLEDLKNCNVELTFTATPKEYKANA